jgi:hypothetical protein
VTDAEPEAPEAAVARLRRNKALVDAVQARQARVALARARAAQPDIWSDPNPLVTIRICTYNRPRLLVERAVASALRQTYARVEVLVIGDHAAPETAAALAAVDDPRLRYHNLPERGRYPRFPRFFWCNAGAAPAGRAYDLARGSWMTFLDDDDEYPPDHVAVLLDAARQARAELVFGVSDYENADGSWTRLGRFERGQLCSGAVMFSARLFGVRADPHSWINDEPGDWNVWRRMQEAGASIASVSRVVFRHYAEKSVAGATAAERQRMDEEQATPQQILDDVAFTGAGHLLSLP